MFSNEWKIYVFYLVSLKVINDYKFYFIYRKYKSIIVIKLILVLKIFRI